MMEGRPSYCIYMYNKCGGGIHRWDNKWDYIKDIYHFIGSNLSKHCYMYYSGDRILIAIRGKKKKGILKGWIETATGP